MVPSSEVVYSSGPPGAVYRLDAEAGVGDGLGQVGAVHLYQMDAR